jgi:hypothetical protein
MTNALRYNCHTCRRSCPADEARRCAYRCPHCRAGMLIAEQPAPGTIRSVRPSRAADAADTGAPAAPDGVPVVDGRSAEALVAVRRAQRISSSASARPEQIVSSDESSGPGEVWPGENESQAVLILPPPFNLKGAPAMEQLAGTLALLTEPVALEIAGARGERQLLVRGGESGRQSLVDQLYAVFNQIDVEAVDSLRDPAAQWARADLAFVSVSLRLARASHLSLKTFDDFSEGDPLHPVLGAFDSLRAGETLVAQVILRGAAPADWADADLQRLADYQRRGYGGEGAPAPARSVLGFAGGWLAVTGVVLSVLLAGLGLWGGELGRAAAWVAGAVGCGAAAYFLFRLRDRDDWRLTLTAEAEQKLRDKALAVEIRLHAAAPTPVRAQEILTRLIAAYQVFDTTSGNQLTPSPLPPEIRPGNLAAPPDAEPLYLNVQELAGLWHLPVGEALERVRLQTYECLLPASAAEVTDPDGVRLGVSRKGGHAFAVDLSRTALDLNGLLIGKTRQGKTTLLEHLAARLMRDADRSLLVIDPHGDMARRLVGLVPRARVGDVLYIDLSDSRQAIGLNLLDVSSGLSPEAVAENFVDVGKALWEGYWGPRMQVPLTNALKALALANQYRPAERQFTILDLPTLLTCSAGTRDKFLDSLPADDPRGKSVLMYFKGEYHVLSPAQREQIIQPVLSKARAFSRTAAVERIVGQPRSTLNLVEALRGRKIIILNTNAGLVGDDLAGFLGSLFLNIMRRVVMQQTELPPEERVRVTLLTDEFQKLNGTDFPAMLGELQKYGGSLWLGTQALDNLRRQDESGAVVGSIFAGVETRCVFRTNGEDARYLIDRELDVARVRAESLTNLPPHVAYIKTLRGDGRPLPVFTLALDPPLAPEAEVAGLVHARRGAYTTPAAEADRQVRESLSRFGDQFEVPESVAGIVRPGLLAQATAAVNGPAGMFQPGATVVPPPAPEPGANREREAERGGEQVPARPKAALPTWVQPAPPPEDAALGKSLAGVAPRTETGGS